MIVPDSGCSPDYIDEVVNKFSVWGPETEMVVQLPFGDAQFNYTNSDSRISGRWLEELPLNLPRGPWKAEVCRRARLTFFDGVLILG